MLYGRLPNTFSFLSSLTRLAKSNFIASPWFTVNLGPKKGVQLNVGLNLYLAQQPLNGHLNRLQAQ